MLSPPLRLAAAMMIGTDQARVDALCAALEAVGDGGFRGRGRSIREIAREHKIDHVMVWRDVRKFCDIMRWATERLEPPVELRVKES